MATLIRRRVGRMGNDRGSELIELAIVLPILLLVCAAIMDFGFLFQRYEVVTNAAREGARIATLPGYSVTDVQNRVNDYLAASGLPAAPTAPSVTYSNVAIGGTGPTVSVVTVSISYPSTLAFLSVFSGLVGGNGYTSINLTGTSVMRTEAPAVGS